MAMLSENVEMRTTLPTSRSNTSPIVFCVASATTAGGVGVGGGVAMAVGTAVGMTVGMTVGNGDGSAVGATVGKGTMGCWSLVAPARVVGAAPALVSAALGLSKRRITPITVRVVPAATTSSIAAIAPGTMSRLRHVRLRP